MLDNYGFKESNFILFICEKSNKYNQKRHLKLQYKSKCF